MVSGGGCNSILGYGNVLGQGSAPKQAPPLTGSCQGQPLFHSTTVCEAFASQVILVRQVPFHSFVLLASQHNRKSQQIYCPSSIVATLWWPPPFHYLEVSQISHPQMCSSALLHVAIVLQQCYQRLLCCPVTEDSHTIYDPAVGSALHLPLLQLAPGLLLAGTHAAVQSSRTCSSLLIKCAA